MRGSIDTGTAPLTLLPSADALTYGLGSAVGNITISGTEFSRMFVKCQTVGSTRSRSIVVQGITQTNSNAVNGVVSLLAIRDDADIEFGEQC